MEELIHDGIDGSRPRARLESKVCPGDCPAVTPREERTCSEGAYPSLLVRNMRCPARFSSGKRGGRAAIHQFSRCDWASGIDKCLTKELEASRGYHLKTLWRSG